MRVLALVGKEVEHHALAVLGALAVVASAALIGWAIALTENYVTLMSVAHGLASMGFPLLATYLAGRLVVHDHTAGTDAFLAALPVSPALRTAVRWVLGLLVLEGAMFGLLSATALIASRREGVPASFLAALAVQLGAYLLAWHALAFAVASTGRYRWLVWWVLATLGLVRFGDGGAWDLWFGLVREGADRVRLAPPWEALPYTLVWAAAGTVFAFAVASWRGGALVERWFVAATADQQARLIGAGMAVTLLVSVLDDDAPTAGGWALLPAVGGTSTVEVRAAASPGTSLTAIAEAVGTELDALGAAIGVEAWPEVVLLRSRPGVAAPLVELPRAAHASDHTLVVLVDPEQPQRDAVQAVLAFAIGHEMAGSPDADADTRWLAEGLARWWVAADPEQLAALAALGAGSAGRDFHETTNDLGPDVAGAVAWAGLVALEAEGGREAVLALGQALVGLDRWRGAGWPAVAPSWRRTEPGWVGRATGVDEDRWRARWAETLTRAAPPEVPALPAVRVSSGAGDVEVTWDGPWPDGAAIEWLVLDALQRAPVPSDVVERVVPEPGAPSVGLAADPREVVVARVVLSVPGLGRLAGPWTVRP